MPHTPRKRVLRERARASGKSYAQLRVDSRRHHGVSVQSGEHSNVHRFSTGPAQSDMPRIWLLQDLLRRQRLGLGKLFIASIADASVGHLYVHLKHEGAELEVGPLFTYYWVHESRRRTGVGRRLVGMAERWSRQRGYNKVVVLVDPSDAGAVGLYLSLGFYYLSEIESYRNEFQSNGRRIQAPMTLAVYKR